MEPDQIKKLIEAGMQTTMVAVTGDGSKFEATVVSEAFEGLSMLKQHQMVYPILNEHIKSGEIHALSIKSYTPSQWDVKTQAGS